MSEVSRSREAGTGGLPWHRWRRCATATPRSIGIARTRTGIWAMLMVEVTTEAIGAADATPPAGVAQTGDTCSRYLAAMNASLTAAAHVLCRMLVGIGVSRSWRGAPPRRRRSVPGAMPRRNRACRASAAAQQRVTQATAAHTFSASATPIRGARSLHAGLGRVCRDRVV